MGKFRRVLEGEKMSFEITVEIEVTKKYQVTSGDILEIARDYNGDVDEWTKDNISEFSDDDYYVESIRYNKEKAKELVTNMSSVSIERVLNADDYIVDENEVNLTDHTKVNVDISALKNTLVYSDANNPKDELNGIYLSGNKMEATDTKRLISLVTNNKIKGKAFIPIAFAELIINGAKLYVLNDKDMSIIVKSDSKYYRQIFNDFKFPNTDRILCNIDNKDDSFKRVNINKYSTEAIETVVDNGYIIVSYDSFMIGKLFHDELVVQDIDTVVYRGANDPIHFYGDGLQIVIMPIVI